MTPIKYDIQNIPLAVALAAFKDFLLTDDGCAVANTYQIALRTVYQLDKLAQQGAVATAEAPLATAWESPAPLAVFHLPRLGCLSGIVELLQTVQRHQETDHHNPVLALVLLPRATGVADVQANSQGASEHTPAMPLSDGHNQPARG